MKYDVRIYPGLLHGQIKAPSSKSQCHRLLIAAALSGRRTVLENATLSMDIRATADVLSAFGASVKTDPVLHLITVDGISSPPSFATADCRESGSTLRFLLPVAAALGVEASFSGQGKLPQRPLTPYLRELPRHGVTFDRPVLPLTMRGQLQNGTFELEGNISSQFVSGLLFALPLLQGDSEIHLLSPLESKPYVDMTVQVLRAFGIQVEETTQGYHVPGGQRYQVPQSASIPVEGDYSQAAFFLVANALGSRVTVDGLIPNSLQGDRAIVSYTGPSLAPFHADMSQIPDLLPVLSVLACFHNGDSLLYNAGRLRIKESDRLSAITDVLVRLGADIHMTEDSLSIRGTGTLHGGEVDSHNDHRIAMAAAVAATRCSSPVTIHGADCVSKSYPEFFADFKTLGGKVDVIPME